MEETNQTASPPMIENTLLRKYMEEMESYINRYEGKVTSENAREVMEAFKPEWEKSLGQTIPEAPRKESGVTIYNFISLDSMYADALDIMGNGALNEEQLGDKELTKFRNLITTFDEKVKYFFGEKSSLYFILGICWQRLGKIYVQEAVYAFKKHLFCISAQDSTTKHSTPAYKFCSCSKFLFQSLANETLGLTSPTLFNDPFDCPILEFLNQEDEIALLMRRAYRDSLKVSCFVNNFFLPTQLHDFEKPRKQPNNINEYEHLLMWAHYGDSHKGICIKYDFPASLSIGGDDNSSAICFFQDVEYSELLNESTKHGNMDTHSAFFRKGKAWEYENELRLIHFDLNGKEGYDKISVPGCIEAVYFGLKCSKEDEEAIRNILADKKHIRVDREENQTEESIRFYRMIKDTEHFGQLVAVEA